MPALSISDLKPPELAVNRLLIPELDSEEYRTKKTGEPAFCFIKEMTAHDRDRRVDKWWATRQEEGEEDAEGRMAWVAAACLCNADGSWLAGSALEVADLAEKLQTQKASMISRIVTAANALNGMGKTEVERIEKN